MSKENWHIFGDHIVGNEPLALVYEHGKQYIGLLASAPELIRAVEMARKEFQSLADDGWCGYDFADEIKQCDDAIEAGNKKIMDAERVECETKTLLRKLNSEIQER